MIHIRNVPREDFHKQLIRKMAPPPLYVKVEKLDIMVRLANEHNVDALLSELKEYVA